MIHILIVVIFICSFAIYEIKLFKYYINQKRENKNLIITLQNNLIKEKQDRTIYFNSYNKLRDILKIERLEHCDLMDNCVKNYKKILNLALEKSTDEIIGVCNALLPDETSLRKRKCTPIHFGDDGLDSDSSNDLNY
jgi:hypothetical protein